MRAALVVLTAAALLLAGCGDDRPVAAAGDAHAEQHLRRDCADPQWKEQNLGLWYSLCRKPMRW